MQKLELILSSSQELKISRDSFTLFEKFMTHFLELPLLIILFLTKSTLLA